MVGWCLVVDWSMNISVDISMSVVVDILMWVISIDDVVLSVLGFISFMDGLWVDVVVIVVVVVMMVFVVLIVVLITVMIFTVLLMTKAVLVVISMAVGEWVVVGCLIHAMVKSVVSETVFVIAFITVVSSISIALMAFEVTVVSSCFISMVAFVVGVMSITSEVSVSEVTVISVVSKGLNGMSVSWSVSVMVVMEVVWLLNMWLIESVVVISLSWAESGVSVVTVMFTAKSVVLTAKSVVLTAESVVFTCITVVFWVDAPFAMVVKAMVWVFMVWSLMVMAWEVLLTVVLSVRSLPVWAMLSVFMIIDWLESWVDVSGGGFMSLLKCVSFSHLVSEVRLVFLNFTSVLINVMAVVGVWELVWVNNEWAMVWGNNCGMWGQRSVVCLSEFVSVSKFGVNMSESVMLITEMFMQVSLPLVSVVAETVSTEAMSSSVIEGVSDSVIDGMSIKV